MSIEITLALSTIVGGAAFAVMAYVGYTITTRSKATVHTAETIKSKEVSKEVSKELVKVEVAKAAAPKRKTKAKVAAPA